MRPDFKQFIGVGQMALLHSAKGSTWENHKYIKRIDGTYYYPDSYEGGRHISDAPGSGGENSSDTAPEIDSLSENDVENLAREVIRGNFANGQERKELLGEYYQQVQDRVNEILLGSSGSKKVSDVSEEQTDVGEKAVEKAASSSATKGLDYEKIFSVYRKK